MSDTQTYSRPRTRDRINPNITMKPDDINLSQDNGTPPNVYQLRFKPKEFNVQKKMQWQFEIQNHKKYFYSVKKDLMDEKIFRTYD